MANVNLSEDTVKDIKDVFEAVYENEENAKALTKANSEIKKALAEKLQLKSEEVNKAYAQWKLDLEKPDVSETVDSIMAYFKS